jgi:hypothetical protein
MSLNKIQVEKVNGAKMISELKGSKVRKPYQSPKLVVVGSSIELVQGGGNTAYQDGRGYLYTRPR